MAVTQHPSPGLLMFLLALAADTKPTQIRRSRRFSDPVQCRALHDRYARLVHLEMLKLVGQHSVGSIIMAVVLAAEGAASSWDCPRKMKLLPVVNTPNTALISLCSAWWCLNAAVFDATDTA